MQKLIDGDWIAYEGLSREDLDAFFLNLRFFFLGGDGISVSRLANVYSDLPVDYAHASSTFIELRNRYQGMLDKPTNLSKAGTCITRKELLDILMFGGFSHFDDKHHALYLRLTTKGVFSLFSFIAFMSLTHLLLDYFYRFSVLNSEVLKWFAEDKVRVDAIDGKVSS